MQPNFKHIITGIMLCLCLVFVGQVFWLKGLYHSISMETEKSVLECVEAAEMDELQYRIERLKNDTTKNGSITIARSIENEKEEKDIREQVKVVETEEDTTNMEQVAPDPKDNMYLKVMESLFKKILGATHQAIDSIMPVDFAVLDSIIIANFEHKGIQSKLYYIEIVDVETQQIIRTSLPDFTVNRQIQTFTYIYDMESNLAYRIHIEPLTKTILLQMSGILGTTLLIILLLSFAFWYLIRTILRQKTLEEMKDDFTNNMTHELKTPIAVAYSAADALLNFKQGDDKTKREKYLSVCKDQLSELSGLVEQILSMSMEKRKRFVLNKETINIKDLIDTLIEQHRLKSDKHLLFNICITPDDLNLFADRTHLSNIISNLIDNAIKYSGEKVDIDIHVYQKDKYHLIEVKDKGMGIPSEKQAYVFDKFYRVTYGNKYSTKGYGLGLFYVKTMVEKHQGTVSVSSTLGKGSTFTIKMPV